MIFRFHWLHKIILLLILGLLGWGVYLQFNQPKPQSLPIQNHFQNKKMILSHGQITSNILKNDHQLPLVRSGNHHSFKIYHLSLGINADMNDAISWLKEHFPHKKFLISHFSYGLYNENDRESLVSFNKRLKEPIPTGFLLAYLKGNIKESLIQQEVTLKQLIEQHRHQTTLYLFWRREPSYKNNFLFSPDDYQLEIDYDQGTPFGGASYLHINQITFRHKQNKQIIASYPVNIRIEEPFVIFNYDFQLRFPFYNYKKEGTFWYTNQIKSLKKIDLYEKRTGQSRTLYYDVE